MDPRNRRKTDNDVTGELCHRFGVIAVRKGFITLDELKTAVLIQVDDDVNGLEHRTLGNILCDRGQITEEQIDIVLQELKKTLH
jgi:hypothetical protein